MVRHDLASSSAPEACPHPMIESRPYYDNLTQKPSCRGIRPEAVNKRESMLVRMQAVKRPLRCVYGSLVLALYSLSKLAGSMAGL
jgi:hypothetical protein